MYKWRPNVLLLVYSCLCCLILAKALSMIPSSTTLQTFVVWLILMVSAMIHLLLQPYNEGPSKRCAHKNFFEPLVLFMSSEMVNAMRVQEKTKAATMTIETAYCQLTCLWMMPLEVLDSKHVFSYSRARYLQDCFM